jgi:hypothetical protein
MKKVTVTWKRQDGEKARDQASNPTEYKVEDAGIQDGFLHLMEDLAGERVTHISVDEIALWTEEELN